MDILNFVVDAILVLIVLVGIALGIKRGFVKTVAKPVKFVAALYVAFAACGAVAEKLIMPFIKTPVTARLTEFMQEKCAHLTADNVTEELPSLLKLSAGLFGINVEEVAQNSANDVINALINELTTPILNVIAIIISFVLLYFVSRLVLTLVIAILDAILNVGVIGILNKLLGFVFGTAFAAIMAWALVVVANFIMGFVGYDFEGGFIYNLLNNLNPIDLLLSF